MGAALANLQRRMDAKLKQIELKLAKYHTLSARYGPESAPARRAYKEMERLNDELSHLAARQAGGLGNTHRERPGQTFIPPREVQEAAAKGLFFRKRFGRGGTAVGWARARDLRSGRPVSLDTIRRMHSYFLRHAVDAKGKNWSNPLVPSAGKIAWLLWGGDAGHRWVDSILHDPKMVARYGDPDAGSKTPHMHGLGLVDIG